MKKAPTPKSGMLILLPLCLLIITFAGCRKNGSPATAAPDVKATTPMLSYIKKLGFKDTQIQDLGSEYLVDGDIVFSKSAVIDTAKPAHEKEIEQYGTAHYVNQNIAITVTIDNSMGNYVNEIIDAISQWNNVPSRLRFYVLGSTASAPTTSNITITNANLGNSICGDSQFPINGQPGALIRINTGLISGMPYLQRRSVIIHELGHTIGFRHTNWTGNEPQMVADAIGSPADAVQIPGTPGTGGDPSSIMNGSTCGAAAATLSNFDKTAFQFLYPPVNATFVRVEYSNYNVTTYDHYGYRDGVGSYIDGSVYIHNADVTIKVYSDAACTIPLALTAPLTVTVIYGSTHGPSSTGTYNIAAGANSYALYSQTVVEAETVLSDTDDDNLITNDVRPDNATYIALPTRG